MVICGKYSAVVCVVLLFVALIPTAQAQTLLSGSLSGTLTRIGNPYIVTDSCWVATDSQLTLQAGVNILFRRNMIITINGTLQVLGTLGDSVFFAPESANVQWWCLNFHSGTHLPTIRYASFIGAQYGIYAVNSPIDLHHCFFDNNCSFASHSSSITADSCWFIDNVSSYCDGSGTLTNCRIESLDGVQFFGTGTYTNCLFVYGNSVSGNPTVMTDVHFAAGGNLGGESVSVSLTRVTGHPSVRIADANGGHSSTFIDCQLRQLWYEGSGSTITVNHCVLDSWLYVAVWPSNGNGLTVQIDSTRGPTLELILINNSQATIRNSVFYNQTPTSDVSPFACLQFSNTQALIDRCTIVQRQWFFPRDTALIQIGEGNTRPVTIQNSVLYHATHPIIVRGNGASPPILRYNAFQSPRPFYNVTADSTNRIGWLRLQNISSGNDSLRLYSIAIDGADPLLPHDADSSCADCGAIPFDHRAIHPIEAWQDTTRRQSWVFTSDTLKNYVVTLWDTLPSVSVQVLPTLGPTPLVNFRQPVRSWDTLQIALHANGDSLASGTYRMIVANGVTMPDTVSIGYRFYPSLPSILHDTVLTRAHSPYWICRPVTIPRGDTVKIDSGVTVYHTLTPGTQPVWQVYGTLQINGTPNDSVRFQQVFPFDAHAWIGSMVVDSGGSLLADYWNLDTTEGFYLTKRGNGSLVLRSSRLPVLLLLSTKGTNLLRSSEFFRYPYYTYGGIEFFADSDSVAIISTKFHFRCFLEIYDFYHHASYLIDSCMFMNAGIELDDSVKVTHSVFYNSFQTYDGSVTIQLKRNLLIGAQSVITKTVNSIPSPLPPVTVVNSLFLNTIRPLRQYNNAVPQYDVRGCLFWQCDTNQLQDVRFGQLTRINRNGDSTDFFGNLFQNPLFTDSTTIPWQFALHSPIRNGGVFDSLPYLGSAPDIGPWEIDTSVSAVKETVTALPTTFSVGKPYPNPTNGMFKVTIQSPRANGMELTFYNCLGQTILHQFLHVIAGKNSFTIRCPDTLPTGLYFVQVGGENARFPILLLK